MLDDDEYNEFAAFEWEELDREAERDWYTFDEGGLIDDQNPDK